LLEFQDVGKRFGDGWAIRGLTLHLPDRGIVGLVGPNGSGKTTLINVATGFLPSDRGACLYNGEVISSRAPYEIVGRGVARTFQDLRLIGRLTALENLMLGFPPHRGEKVGWAVSRLTTESERRLEVRGRELLERIGLGDEIRKPARDLSYGQQKLLSLARCMATDASALLLDEPFAGVAPKVRPQIVDLLRREAENGRLLVVVEHDLALIREIAQSVAVLVAGSLIGYGLPGDIFAQESVRNAYFAGAGQ
jgi:ABC-type branched-subunit amino acid transport system ATPase component